MIKIEEKVTHTIDCGRNSGVIYHVEEDRHETLTHAQILDLPNQLPPGSFVAGEERTSQCREQKNLWLRFLRRMSCCNFTSTLKKIISSSECLLMTTLRRLEHMLRLIK